MKKSPEDESDGIDETELFNKIGVSKCQTEIISLLDKGLKRKEIADILKIWIFFG